MLADALAEDRSFAVINSDSLDSDYQVPVAKSVVATLGLIRMSSQEPDGSSLLMLEGTERVRVEQLIRNAPYPVFNIERLPTTNRPNDELEAEIVVDLLGKVDQLSALTGPNEDQTAQACHEIDDIEMLNHFIMQSYCANSVLMQQTLETTDLVKRCKLASDFLALQITLMRDAEY